MPLFAYAIVLCIPPLSALLLGLAPVSNWLLVALVWVGLPIADGLVKASGWNPSPAEEAGRRASPWFDVLLYLAVPAQLVAVGAFVLRAPGLTPFEFVGGALFAGTACGVLAINVGHELGHRGHRGEQFLAKLLLTTSLYSHFFVEHNRGHHARVATPDDPASARRGEGLYTFWARSISGSLSHAWELEATRLGRLGRSAWSLGNEVLRWKLAEVGVTVVVAVVVGPVGAGAFVGAAVVGLLLLETVNYVEHYGLSRQRKAHGAYERVGPQHSWTSDHPISRAVLFDLPRHADHHANPTRPFQVLRHMPEAPVLPTGYAGMVLLALVPPLFARVMDRHLQRELQRLSVAA